MKKIFFLLSGILLLTSSISVAQENRGKVVHPTEIKTPAGFAITPSLKDKPVVTDFLLADKEFIFNNHRDRKINPDITPPDFSRMPDDPGKQTTPGTIASRATIQDFAGQNSGSYPPDCNGTVNAGYYFQVVNTTYAIFDKSSGAILAGPSNLNTIFDNSLPGTDCNNGDPIVLWDEQANKWFYAEFSVCNPNDYMLIAVSQTPDPTGAWWSWSFDVDDMPDYMKFGIWQDGYYMATNTGSGNDVYVFERSKMITGDPNPQMIGFDNPDRPSTFDGFHCILPFDNDGAWAPAGSPGQFITIADDGQSNPADALYIYELNADWTTPSNSTFSRTQVLNVNPFSGNFNSSWENIPQPGVSQKLDGLSTILMYRAQYRNFGGDERLVIAHTIAESSSEAALRWYELQRTGAGNWSIRQQSTYNPDNVSRWNMSIAMNGNKEIGIGYSVGNSSVFPGIRYAGQSVAANAAANNTLDVAETVIWDGAHSQDGIERWGDYSNISVDPSDDHTFWYTNEYMGSSTHGTRIVSFQLSAANSPPVADFSADNTNPTTSQTVTFTDTSSNSPTSWSWSFSPNTVTYVNGTSSTSQNPQVVFDSEGLYTVTLTATNAYGSDDEVKTDYINVSNSCSYCESTGTMVYNTSTTRVIFNTLDNATAKPAGYNDYTAMSTDLMVSGTYDLTVQVNTDGNYTVRTTVWIDWNQDCDFDDTGESYDLGSATNVTDGATDGSPLGITVPANATPGTTRMRVSTKYISNPTACEMDFDGEVEDYTLNIIAGTTCADPSNLSATNETTTGADLSWTENGSATTWDLEIGLQGFSPTGTPTDSGVTSNPYTWTGGSASTSYDFYVRADCGGSTSSWVGPYTFTTAGCTYCNSSYSNTTDDWISNVTLNTIDNDSGSAGYEDFTSLSTDLETGQTYTASVDVTVNGNWTQQVWLWIDWNQDCDFDDTGEGYDLGNTNGSTGTHTLTLNITVPGTATLGGTRMRVMEKYGSDPSDACTSGSYGETEDYSLNIIAGTGCADPSGLSAGNISFEGADLSWTENGSATTWDLEIGLQGFSPTGTPTDSGVTSNPYTWTGGSASTSYDFYVRADCGGSTSSWVGPYTFTTDCDPVLLDVEPNLYEEGFENSSAYRDCWSFIYEDGSADWTYDSGSSGGNIDSAYEGTLNARFVSSGPSGAGSPVTKLVSPPFDISGISKIQMDFWYGQETWDDDQNELKVYYKSYPSGTWTLLRHYTDNIDAWTYEALEIPYPGTGQYIQIAFEGINNWGRANVIDNFRIGEFTCDGNITRWDGSTWDNGSPTNTDIAILNGDYNISTPVVACNLFINSQSATEIEGGASVTLAHDLTNEGSLFISNTASLVQTANDATVNGGGDYTVEIITTEYNEYDYTYFSSPMTSATIEDALVNSGGSPANYIFSLNTTTFNDSDNDTFDDEGDDWQNASGTMEPGKGYAAIGAGADFPFDPDNLDPPAQETVWFDGTVNAGDISLTVFYDNDFSDSFNNENLIGNPYPSALDLEKFQAENSSVLTGTFHFWTHDTPISNGNPGPDAYNFTNDDYAVGTTDGTPGSFISVASSSGTNCSKDVAAGQGFLADVVSGTAGDEGTQAGVILFRNEMRNDNNDTFLHPQNTGDRIWLNLTDEEGRFRQIAIAFAGYATGGYDRGLDAGRMFLGDAFDFYSLIDEDDTHYAIQTLGAFSADKHIRIGIQTVYEGTYQIALDHVSGIFSSGQPVYLKDLYTGTVINLTETNSYSFQSIAGTDIDNRFEILFQMPAGVSGLQDISALAFPNPSGGIFNITWSENVPAGYILTELTGRVISTGTAEKEQNGLYPLDLTGQQPGVYLLRLRIHDREKVLKLFLEPNR